MLNLIGASASITAEVEAEFLTLSQSAFELDVARWRLCRQKESFEPEQYKKLVEALWRVSEREPKLLMEADLRLQAVERELYELVALQSRIAALYDRLHRWSGELGVKGDAPMPMVAPYLDWSPTGNFPGSVEGDCGRLRITMLKKFGNAMLFVEHHRLSAARVEEFRTAVVEVRRGLTEAYAKGSDLDIETVEKLRAEVDAIHDGVMSKGGLSASFESLDQMLYILMVDLQPIGYRIVRECGADLGSATTRSELSRDSALPLVIWTPSAPDDE